MRFLRFVNEKSSALFDVCYAYRKVTITIATFVAVVGLYAFSFLGTEFLPSIILSILVTGAASLVPVRIATSVDPAIVLRGE